MKSISTATYISNDTLQRVVNNTELGLHLPLLECSAHFKIVLTSLSSVIFTLKRTITLLNTSSSSEAIGVSDLDLFRTPCTFANYETNMDRKEMLI